MKKLLAISIFALTATAANADAAWLQYSIWSPGDLLLPWNRPDVYGLRLDMPYGGNKGSIYGVDLGLVGLADGDMLGFQSGVVSITDIGDTMGLQVGALANRTMSFYGLQLSGFLNWNDDVFYGMQVGTVNFDGELYGLQIGAINWFVGNACGASIGGFHISNNSFTGFTAGALNYELHRMTGFQLGGINLAAESSAGLQLGLVNISKQHEGVQLGLVNINGAGFLPCFLGFNFYFTR